MDAFIFPVLLFSCKQCSRLGYGSSFILDPSSFDKSTYHSFKCPSSPIFHVPPSSAIGHFSSDPWSILSVNGIWSLHLGTIHPYGSCPVPVCSQQSRQTHMCCACICLGWVSIFILTCTVDHKFILRIAILSDHHRVHCVLLMKESGYGKVLEGWVCDYFLGYIIWLRTALLQAQCHLHLLHAVHSYNCVQ